MSKKKVVRKVVKKVKSEEDIHLEKVDEFNKIADASSNFLKAIFPHTNRLIQAIKKDHAVKVVEATVKAKAKAKRKVATATTIAAKPPLIVKPAPPALPAKKPGKSAIPESQIIP